MAGFIGFVLGGIIPIYVVGFLIYLLTGLFIKVEPSKRTRLLNRLAAGIISIVISALISGEYNFSYLISAVLVILIDQLRNKEKMDDYYPCECGNQIPDYLNVCPSCGSERSYSLKVEKMQIDKVKNNKLSIVMLVIIAFGIICLVSMNVSLSNNSNPHTKSVLTLKKLQERETDSKYQIIFCKKVDSLFNPVNPGTTFNTDTIYMLLTGDQAFGAKSISIEIYKSKKSKDNYEVYAKGAKQIKEEWSLFYIPIKSVSNGKYHVDVLIDNKVIASGDYVRE